MIEANSVQSIKIKLPIEYNKFVCCENEWIENETMPKLN